MFPLLDLKEELDTDTGLMDSSMLTCTYLWWTNLITDRFGIAEWMLPSPTHFDRSGHSTLFSSEGADYRYICKFSGLNIEEKIWYLSKYLDVSKWCSNQIKLNHFISFWNSENLIKSCVWFYLSPNIKQTDIMDMARKFQCYCTEKNKLIRFWE